MKILTPEYIENKRNDMIARGVPEQLIQSLILELQYRYESDLIDSELKVLDSELKVFPPHIK